MSSTSGTPSGESAKPDRSESPSMAGDLSAREELVAPPIRTPPVSIASRRLEMRYHLLILCVSVGILTLSFALRVEGDVQVVVPGLGKALPSTCTFKNLVGLDCPGCGLTRSFIRFAQGRWAESFQFHPMGWMMFVFVGLQIPFRLVQLSRLQRNLPVFHWRGAVWLAGGMMILLICQWVVRGVGGRW